jgi:hypothetical protein
VTLQVGESYSYSMPPEQAREFVERFSQYLDEGA